MFATSCPCAVTTRGVRVETADASPAGHEHVGVDHVWAEALDGCPRAARQVRMAAPPPFPAVDDDTLDVVSAIDERAFDVPDEDTEVRRARAGVHLRDEKDLQARVRGRLWPLGVVRAVELAERPADLPDRAVGAQRLSHRDEQILLPGGDVAYLLERGGGRRSVARCTDRPRALELAPFDLRVDALKLDVCGGVVDVAVNPDDDAFPCLDRSRVAERGVLDLPLDKSLLDRGHRPAELVDRAISSEARCSRSHVSAST